MKRFFLKSVLFLCILAVLLFLVSGMYVHTNLYKNMEINDRTDRYPHMPEAVDVAVFGASHGYEDFRTGPEGTSFFNYSMSSQTPQYDWMMLRQYQDHIRPGALVVLTVSYLSPFWTDPDYAFANKQPRYYRILSAENIVDVDLTKYYLQKYFPVLTAKTSDIFESFLCDPEPLTQTEASFTPEQLPSEQERIRTDHWTTCIQPSYPDTNPVMMDAFRQILDMCRENDWVPVLVTPPYLPEYNDCFPEEFYPVFYRAVDELCEEYDVPYLDYSHDESYAGRYDLCRNIDHLNEAGAAIFDEQFYSDLQRLDIWSATP